MNTRGVFFIAGVALVVGIAIGILVQRRWPVGRWKSELSNQPTLAEVAPATLAGIPADRRLVLLCIGQSNAANYGETKRNSGPNVYAFSAGKLYQANDPLPGGDGYGGSVWSRLGARLVSSTKLEAVVLAVVARGSTYARDWAPGGSCHPQLAETLAALRDANLPVDFVLWQQGEQEARQPEASGREYLRALEEIRTACTAIHPAARFVVSRSTFGSTVNEQIREAQRLAATLPGTLSGPDLDALNAPFRSDGIHFNDLGLSEAARLWHEALAPLLNQRGGTP